MEQRYVIHFLYLKGMKREEIHAELIDVYGDDALSLSSVKYWCHEFKVGRKCLEDAPRSGRPPEIYLSDLVAKEMNKDPYLTANQIAKKFDISPQTAVTILSEDLGYLYKHLRWVPHLLTCEMKEKRVEQCKLILNALETARRSHFNGIMTGDESWFLYSYQPTHQWVLHDEKPGEIVERSHYQRKIMVSIYITMNGKFLVDIMPKGCNFNSNYFCGIILPQLEKLAFPNGKKKNDKKWILHFDNAPSHRSKLSTETLNRYPFRSLPNPPFSPDVSPLDFGGFGTVKEKMPIGTFEDDDELKENIEEILSHLGPGYFKSLFTEWERRLNEVIRTNGEFVH